jgi:hypothetical protein
MQKCKAKTTAGKKCQAKPLRNGEWCFIHDPASAAKRAKGRKKGGLRNRTPHYGDTSIIPADVKTLNDAKHILDYTLAELLPMENSISRARVLLALHESFVKAFEIGQLEERIKALEELSKA